MKYKGEPDYKHGSRDRLGVLLTNLGTPENPSPVSLKKYLKEFLSDPRVIEVPRIIWQIILRGFILNTRPKKVAKLYKSIWLKKGSPLLVTLKSQTKKIKKKIGRKLGDTRFELAMRYGDPSIESGLAALNRQGCRRILILPLYPQYCAATTGSTFDKVTKILRGWRWIPEVRFVNGYFDHPMYINALCESIKTNWKTKGRLEKIIFSYHGVPKKYLLKGDPYHCFCQKTTRLVVEKLKLKEKEYMTTFQSRFGPDEWLQPYTDKTLESLPAKGVKKIHIISPGFSSDCLETLEELEKENKEIFLGAGGLEYNYIPCLNESPNHINLLSELIINHTKGWPENKKKNG